MVGLGGGSMAVEMGVTALVSLRLPVAWLGAVKVVLGVESEDGEGRILVMSSVLAWGLVGELSGRW